jgi:hypothetical protein
MLRKAVCAAVVLAFVGLGSARAEEINGSIKSIKDGKVTFATNFDKDTKTFKDEKTYTLAKDCKVVNAKFSRKDKKVTVGDEIKEGLKTERLSNIGDRGVRAQIVTNDAGQVTEIRVFQPRKGKKPAE